MSSDSEHIELLRRGPRAWNAWRASNPTIIPRLIGVALSAGERQMGPINGGPVDLAAARLRHATLIFATLTGANLDAADLSDADLRDARLDRANLTAADLSEALLDRADFSGAKLTGANICGASLQEARNLTQAQIEDAIGDAFTILPAHLSRPEIWTVSPVVGGPRSRHAAEEAGIASQLRPDVGARTSWLVGGPRSANVTARSDTPLRNSDGA